MPELYSPIVMLRIECEVNRCKVQAMVDSGAEATIMSWACAMRCGVVRLVDEVCVLFVWREGWHRPLTLVQQDGGLPTGVGSRVGARGQGLGSIWVPSSLCTPALPVTPHTSPHTSERYDASYL